MTARRLQLAWLTALATVLLSSLVIAGHHPGQVDDGRLVQSSAQGDDWLTYGQNPAETRYSPLADIDATNVHRLQSVWSYRLDARGGGQQATPLVWNGTIYTISNWSIVFAIDARTGQERWHWNPEINQATVRRRNCCNVVNRGLAIYKDLLIAPTIDGRLQGLHLETGKVVWEARVAYPQDDHTITMAPRIAKGKVIIGVSGGDKQTRGYFDAYDAMTGHRAWRFYTVPGDPAAPPENAAMAHAATTWDMEWWKRGGGGAVWDGMSYDPEAELVYVGTGNAEPWTFRHRSSRDKDNLYVASILAVDVNTGDLRWHFQVVPGDNWDYDSVQQLTLADLTIAGRPRKVIMQANKNGFFYLLDRLTGEFLSADPFSQVTWAKGIDPRTGRPIVNDAAFYGLEGIELAPGAYGAHNWAPMSFHPATQLVYIPTATGNRYAYAAEPTFKPQPGSATGTTQGTAALPSPPAIGPEPIPGPNGGGALVAWDPLARRIRWRQPGGGSTGGGTVTTAGNLVFQAIDDGRLMAYSADEGKKLLELDTGLRDGMGPPITYRLDGVQYVAVMGGRGSMIGTSIPRLVTFALDGGRPSSAPPPAGSSFGQRVAQTVLSLTTQGVLPLVTLAAATAILALTLLRRSLPFLVMHLRAIAAGAGAAIGVVLAVVTAVVLLPFALATQVPGLAPGASAAPLLDAAVGYSYARDVAAWQDRSLPLLTALAFVVVGAALYLLYRGLARWIPSRDERAVAYAAAVVVCMVVLSAVAAAIGGVLVGVRII